GWRLTPSANAPTGNSVLFSSAATSASDVWSVGYFDDGSFFRTLTEHWDGSRWSLIASPDAGDGYDLLGSVAALAKDDAWAVGSHQPFGGSAQPLAMRWNGSSWQLVPTPIPPSGDSRLLGVAGTSGDDVWAVGATNAARQKALILHWDGRVWNSVPVPAVDQGAALSDVTALQPDDAWAVGTATTGAAP